MLISKRLHHYVRVEYLNGDGEMIGFNAIVLVAEDDDEPKRVIEFATKQARRITGCEDVRVVFVGSDIPDIDIDKMKEICFVASLLISSNLMD